MPLAGLPWPFAKGGVQRGGCGWALVGCRTPEERESWYAVLEENVRAERERIPLALLSVPVHFKLHKQPDEVRNGQSLVYPL